MMLLAVVTLTSPVMGQHQQQQYEPGFLRQIPKEIAVPTVPEETQQVAVVAPHDLRVAATGEC